jgi:hypothetical protein
MDVMGLFIRIEDESDFNEPFSDPDNLTGIMQIQRSLFCPLCALTVLILSHHVFEQHTLWYAGAVGFILVGMNTVASWVSNTYRKVEIGEHCHARFLIRLFRHTL